MELIYQFEKERNFHYYVNDYEVEKLFKNISKDIIKKYYEKDAKIAWECFKGFVDSEATENDTINH